MKVLFAIILSVAPTFAQLYVYIAPSKRVRDAQWYEITIQSKHEHHILVSGEMVLRTVSQKLDPIPPSNRYKAPRGKTVISKLMTMDLTKKSPVKAFVLAKPIVNFSPYDLLIDPPYLPPQRTTAR